MLRDAWQANGGKHVVHKGRFETRSTLAQDELETLHRRLALRSGQGLVAVRCGQRAVDLARHVVVLRLAQRLVNVLFKGQRVAARSAGRGEENLLQHGALAEQLRKGEEPMHRHRRSGLAPRSGRGGGRSREER